MRFEDVDLEVGEVATLDARLSLAGTSTEIEVKAAAPLLERNNADVAGTVYSDQIENLPTNGRNWASLLLLAPLAMDDGGGDQRSIRFAGRARDDNNYRMDGVDATGIQEQAQKSTTRLQISSDAIEEYRVNSALYTAEYGAGAGGQVDIVSKSGTNEFHGSAFDYLRNSVFDSRSFLDLDLDPGRHGPYQGPSLPHEPVWGNVWRADRERTRRSSSFPTRASASSAARHCTPSCRVSICEIRSCRLRRR